MKITDELVERISRDKRFWHKIAAEIIAEASQNVPRGTSDSAIAEIGAQPLPLGRLLESHSPQRTRVRLPLPGSGPRMVPMIAEVDTLSPQGGVLLSQGQARRLRRQWDRGRLRGQEQAQRIGERGDAAGEEEEEGANPMQDHPGKSCGDAHAGMSHDDFLRSEEEEEEEEESRNPLYRQNSASARSISPSRRTRERER